MNRMPQDQQPPQDSSYEVWCAIHGYSPARDRAKHYMDASERLQRAKAESWPPDALHHVLVDIAKQVRERGDEAAAKRVEESARAVWQLIPQPPRFAAESWACRICYHREYGWFNGTAKRKSDRHAMATHGRLRD